MTDFDFGAFDATAFHLFASQPNQPDRLTKNSPRMI